MTKKKRKTWTSHAWLLYSVAKQNVLNKNLISEDSQHYSLGQVISQPKLTSEQQIQFLELMKMSQTFCVAKLLNVGKVKHDSVIQRRVPWLTLMQAFRAAFMLI